MQPADITRLVTLGAPTVSPDGRWAVVAAGRPDLDEDENRSALWIVATDGSDAPRRLTQGPHDGAPRYSPDGRWLAFLRVPGEGAPGAPAAGRPQLHLLPTSGGDARALTELPLGAGAPVWSPDSTRIAFCARVGEPSRYGQDAKVPAEKEPPRRITGLQYRLDGIGFVGDRRTRIFVVDLPDPASAAQPEPRLVHTGAPAFEPAQFDDEDVAWSPDGTRLAFTSARHDGRELDRTRDVFVVPADGGGARQLTPGSRGHFGVTWADDDTVLALGEQVDANGGWVARHTGLWRIDADAQDPTEPVRLTDSERYQVAGDRIVLDAGRALVLVENRGAIDVLAVPLTGGDPTPLSAGPRQITGIDAAAGVLVGALTDPGTAGELARLGQDGPRLLTSFGAELQPDLLPVVELETDAPDGYPVHGWLAVPPGDGPHPVLLLIHGGPFAQYGWTLLDEVQVYARAGYAVVFGNPRGSSGYGQAHGAFIVGDVGERQAPDLLALLEHALTRPELDDTRVGVLGGSHGGFMTTWLLGHTDRFRAAVSERAVNAIDSFEGSSDIGWDFADNLYGRDAEQRRRQSPFTYVDRIDTPLLIVHSEHDWRCPVEQAQRLYVALRKRSATVELLLFPGEGHELSRSGTPKHRVARFVAILDWFDRYLRPA